MLFRDYSPPNIPFKPLEDFSCNFGVQLNRMIYIQNPFISDVISRSRSYLKVG